MSPRLRKKPSTLKGAIHELKQTRCRPTRVSRAKTGSRSGLRRSTTAPVQMSTFLHCCSSPSWKPDDSRGSWERM
jgi:hypothetical protein